MPEIDELLRSEAARWQQQVDDRFAACHLDVVAGRRGRDRTTAALDERASGPEVGGHYESGTHRHHRRLPWAVLVSAAAVTALLVSIVVVAFTHHRPTTAPVAGDSVISVTGWHWRLAEVHSSSGTVGVPAALDASIEFYRDGTFLADDSVNAYSGPFRLTDSGYQTADVSITAAAYAGHDATVLAVIAGIRAITPYHGSVDSQLSAGKLIVSAHGYSLTFVNTGSARPHSAAAPSSTRSPRR